MILGIAVLGGCADGGARNEAPAPPGGIPRGGEDPPGFAPVAGGTFTAGIPAAGAGRAGNEERKAVTVRSFYMGKREVTQAEYEAVTGTNPSDFKGANLPVERVTWYDAAEYCNKRSEREGLAAAYLITGRTPGAGYPITGAEVTWNKEADGYRLPTEAEWEYASRAGTAAGAGNFAVNALGLYGMHGKVWEWCWDRYGAYGGAERDDSRGPGAGAERVWRGGAFYKDPPHVRQASRFHAGPGYRFFYVGFRLARNK